MENATATTAPRRFGRLKRWIGRGLLGLLVLVVLAAIVGASYQAIGNRADARRFPQQGKSVSLGPAFDNLTLNIDCRGQGSPTVVLDSGLGVPAAGWNPVQTEVAKFTRVCSYDRAGYGWSGASSAPRTSNQIVKELHALLEAAGEKGPYILVGHSFGGYNVRVYNGQYPSDVAGMVLVDASHEDQNDRMSPAVQAFMKKSIEDLKRQQRLAPLLIWFGVARFSQRNQGEGPGVSKEFGQEMLYLQLQPKFIDASAAEMGLFAESANEVRAAGNLGDKPLVVLTAGKLVPASQLPEGFPKKDFDDFHEIWVNDLQMKEAHLSTRGERIMVPDSDHMIPFERPDTIVSAIHEVYSAANAASPAKPSETGSPAPR
ncbi:MAG TPA: alpha/beta hydrolase [Candidatus Acidoferrum sp.]|nr:alpha/beta hydrolase [Candidatus Acidoferrum sp.]